MNLLDEDEAPRGGGGGSDVETESTVSLSTVQSQSRLTTPTTGLSKRPSFNSGANNMVPAPNAPPLLDLAKLLDPFEQLEREFSKLDEHVVAIR